MSFESYQVTTRTLVVTGRLWSGPSSRHEYVLLESQNPTTLAEAKARAGDFESLDKAWIRTETKLVWVEETSKALV